MRSRPGAVVAVAVLVLALAPRVSRAGDAPTQLGLVVMLRALAYDRHFASHGDSEFVVVVPQPRDEGHGNLTREAEAVNGTKLAGRQLRVKLVADDAQKELEGRVGAVVLSGALPPEVRARWSKAALARKVYVLGLDAEVATEHAFLAVTTVGDHVQLLYNHKLADALGVEFPSNLLKLVRVVD